MVRTTLRLNETLKGELEALAEAEGTTFTSLIEEAALDLVAKRRNMPTKPVLPELPLFGGDGRNLDLEQLRKELAADDEAYLLRQAGDVL